MEREKIMEYVERRRTEYFQCLQKPERYRKPDEMERIEASLITIECLAIECGIIERGTI